MLDKNPHFTDFKRRDNDRIIDTRIILLNQIIKFSSKRDFVRFKSEIKTTQFLIL